MTDTTLTWIGIITQWVALIVPVVMVTVGNLVIKRREKEVETERMWRNIEKNWDNDEWYEYDM